MADFLDRGEEAEVLDQQDDNDSEVPEYYDTILVYAPDILNHPDALSGLKELVVIRGLLCARQWVWLTSEKNNKTLGEKIAQDILDIGFPIDMLIMRNSSMPGTVMYGKDRGALFEAAFELVEEADNKWDPFALVVGPSTLTTDIPKGFAPIVITVR